MPHDSSNEEVWEEEEMSSDEDSDCGPEFSAPTRTWCKYFVYIRLSVKSDISLSSWLKLQYYRIGTDNYACYFSFQVQKDMI